MRNFRPMSQRLRASFNNPWHIAGAAALVLLLANSFLVDWRIVATGGSIDYRNRVTGARLLGSGIDPFTYKWRPGQPVTYCDVYNNLAVEVSKTTVTPTFLTLMIPFAAFPYKASQFLWLMAQWGLLIGTGVIWWRILAPGWRRWLWAGALVAFTYTLAWRLHIDRGQMYVLLTLLVSLWLALVKHGGAKAARWAGWTAGLLVGLRPPMVLLLAPFIWWQGRNQLKPAIVSGLICLFLPMLFRTAIWPDYLAGMAKWSEIYRNNAEPRPPPQAYPPTIEGMKVEQMGRFRVVQYVDSSIYRLLREMDVTGAPAWPLLLVLTAGIGGWYWWSRRLELTDQLTGIAAWIFLADWFLPAYRAPYNDVLVLGWLALALLARRRAFWVALAALPLGWVMVSTTPSARWPLHLPTLLFLVSTAVTLGRVRVRKTPENAKSASS